MRSLTLPFIRETENILFSGREGRGKRGDIDGAVKGIKEKNKNFAACSEKVFFVDGYGENFAE